MAVPADHGDDNVDGVDDNEKKEDNEEDDDTANLLHWEPLMWPCLPSFCWFKGVPLTTFSGKS